MTPIQNHPVRIAAWMLFGALALGISGCTTVIEETPAGATTYGRGKLMTTFRAPLRKTMVATEQAVKNLRLAPINRDTDWKTYSYYTNRDGKDRRIRVKLWTKAPGVTGLSIRVYPVGDNVFSLRIYREIKRLLLR